MVPASARTGRWQSHNRNVCLEHRGVVYESPRARADPPRTVPVTLAAWGLRKPGVQNRRAAERPASRLIWEQTSDLARSQAALGSGVVAGEFQALPSL